MLLSLPESRQPAKLPFLFTGGFALPTAKIGIILSVQGVLQMMAQLVIFPWAIKNFGTLRTFRAVILAYPVLYFLTPFVVLLPRYLLMPTVYFILMWKVIGQSLSYPSLMIMIANSAPSRRVLGTLNGAAASSASLSRALGPTAAGLIQTAGLHMGSVGLPWWTSSCVAVVGVVLSFYMKDDHHTAADDSCSSEEDMESFVSDARPASEKVALLHRTDS